MSLEKECPKFKKIQNFFWIFDDIIHQPINLNKIMQQDKFYKSTVGILKIKAIVH